MKNITILVLALTLFGCSLPHIRPVTTERYGHIEVAEFRMALAHIAMVFPDLDTDGISLDAVNVYPVRMVEFRCAWKNVHGCYVPGEGRYFGIWYAAGLDESQARYLLRHELIHYILHKAGYEDWELYHLPWRWHDVHHILLKRDSYP